MTSVMTVKLDASQAKRVTALAKQSGVTKSEVVRRLIDDAELIQTGDDLEAWVEERPSKGFGIRHRA